MLDALQSLAGVAITKRARLDRFFRLHERRAFAIAMSTTKNSDNALDVVQDAMLRMVQYYADKPQDEWAPLFFKVLSSQLADWGRSRAKALHFDAIEEMATTPDELVSNSGHYSPEKGADLDQQIATMADAATTLSPREHQALVLRVIEGYSTKEAALALECSEGTVKSLLNRAKSKLVKGMQEDQNG